MVNVKALQEVFAPDESVTVELNEHAIYAGAFKEAVPILRTLVLGREDRLVVICDDGSLMDQP